MSAKVLVNIRFHDGTLVIGGVFHSPEDVLSALKNPSESTKTSIEKLYNNRGFLPDCEWSDQYRISMVSAQ